MKKAIIYCRVSTLKQETNSLIKQELSCRNFCNNNRIEILGVYSEKGENRKTLNEAIKYAKENKVNYFIVYELDILSREYLVIKEFYNDLKESGIELNESESINNFFIYNDIVKQSIIERDNLINRTIPIEMKLEQMGYHMRSSNFGFRNKKIKTNNGKANIQIIDDIEGKFIRFIFNAKSTGIFNDKQIVNFINSKGYKSRNNKKLTIEQMNKYVRNTIYAGVISTKWTGYNPIKTAYPGIIDINIWNKANNDKIKIIELDSEKVKIEYN